MLNRMLLLLLPLAALAGGCNSHMLEFFLYATQPASKEIKAETNCLAGKSVAVIVYTDKRVDYEYPETRLALSLAVSELLSRNGEVKSVVDCRRIVRYQDDNLEWDLKGKTDLGKSFGAERVVFISMVDYTTREPGSQNLYNGNALGEVSVYDTSLPEREARLWRSKDVKVTYPEKSVVGTYAESDRTVRIKLLQLFSEAVAKKFYDHKVPNE